MNIFILDESPVLAARVQHDRHVIKMSLEACQMLSVACRMDGPIRDAFLSAGLPNKAEIEQFNLLGAAVPDTFDESQLYKITHQNHPASIWTREHPANFIWLAIHLDALMEEAHHRWPGKIRKCDSLRYHFGALAAKLSGLPHPTKPHRGSLGFYTDDSQGNIVPNPELLKHAMTHHTPFVYCGPQGYAVYRDGVIPPDTDMYVLCPVDSYRAYYLAEKAPGNRWTRPDYMPEWLTGHATIHRPPTQAPRKARQPRERKPFVIPPPHTQTASVGKFLSRLASKV
jgi:hypothetical protein